ncbi:PID-CTERM protein-sorting domain-containing protein [Mesonia maritima]|uniref:Uncharacterized protein n=1 Tax=Mesonia maritima TaxID=1793873 RepID=A0ABU1K835_9FLAO|nr:hypothetical protein [Mesonia maritima]MDR6301755.1 hypothetical protein [Mesonia maritima]
MHNIKFYLIAICLLVGLTASAQITLPGGDNVDDETPAAPIDGFVGIALLAGTVFGIKKIRSSKSK